jgi:hypothetical protein
MLPFIRLDYEESIYAKKNILNSEIDILNLANRLNSWRKLRKFELLKKTKLRTSVKSSLTKINLILAEMPQLEGVPRLQMHTKEIMPEKKKLSSIEQELENIREKLARLE